MIFFRTLLSVAILAFVAEASMNIVQFIDEPKETLIPKDDSVKIRCRISEPNAKYSWLLVDEKNNNQEQIVDQNQYITFDNGEYIIFKHHPSVVGKYRCKVVISEIGTIVSRVFTVDIADMFLTKFSLAELGSGKYFRGNKAALVCPYYTVPLAAVEYKWFYVSGAQRKKVHASQTVVFHQNNRIMELRVGKNVVGKYICTAFYAKYGIEKTSPEIEVKLRKNDGKESFEDTNQDLKWIVTPFKSLIYSQNLFYDKEILLKEEDNAILAKEGAGSVELICIANGVGDVGKVNIFWYKEGIRIEDVAGRMLNSQFQYEIRGQGNLVLFNVTKAYIGEYACLASVDGNSENTLRNSFRLLVKPNLIFYDKPTPIVLGDISQEVILNCRINDPLSQNQIAWRKNGELVLSNNYLQQHESSLKILKLLESDEGIFQCLAENEFSSIQTIVLLKINSFSKQKIPNNRPLPVQNLRVKATSYGTLNITWTPPLQGLETILHYEIALFDLTDQPGKRDKISLKAERLETSVLVSKLVPDSFYRIFVYAVNASGQGYTSVVKSSPRVLSKAPSASPTNVTVSEIGSGVATVFWKPPPPDKLNGELIGYRLLVQSSDSLYSKSHNAEVIEKFQLSDLTPVTKYTLRIQALTRGGRGPFSSFDFETKASPNVFDENFQKQQSNNNRLTTNNVVNRDESSVGVNVKADFPGKVEVNNIKGLNNSIAIQWKHPTKGGHVLKYVIKWGQVYPGPYSVTLLYPTSAYVIEKLEPKTQYMIKIIPVNEAGEGKENIFSVFTGSSDIKKIPIPLNLVVKHIGKTSAMLTWEDPSDDVTNTRIYQVQYSLLDSNGQSVKTNSTETKIRIVNLQPSATYAFSVRTGDNIAPQDGADYQTRDWMWSEWSLTMEFTTMGEKPKTSPQKFEIVTIGHPNIKGSEAYTKIAVSWTTPSSNTTRGDDEILSYTIYFSSNASKDLKDWQTQVMPNNQFSSEIIVSGFSNIYYFRIGCRTKHYECPLSQFILYKTPNSLGNDFGLLRIPPKYQYTTNIPMEYLRSKPVMSLNDADNGSNNNVKPESKSHWIVLFASAFGGILLVALVVVAFVLCYKRRNHSSLNGYKLGTKTSNQHIGGAGLLLSNQSPALSNGKVSPHFVSTYNQPLKTPDLFTQLEPHFGEMESDSNQDNDSLRFASVSQHHLASTSGIVNMYNPAIQNHSLIRSHPQMNYFSEMNNQSKCISSTAGIINPLVNINSISIPNPISDSSLGRMQHPNAIYPYPSHPFTQHLLSSGNVMPICSSSCLQPIHVSPQMLATPPHDIHSPATFSNTPRVNASELASHTSSEDIRPLMYSSRISENDISQYYVNSGGCGGGNSTVKSQKSTVPTNLPTTKANVETTQRNPEVVTSISNQTSLETEKGFSTEELTQEMANLEGLMKDLNAITQKEFEC